MVERAQIEARLAALDAQRVELIAQLNATLGAIQDCEYWLTQLAQHEAELSASGSRLEVIKT